MDLTDPQQWNPYTYANNTPVTKSDPTGLKPASFGPEASGWGGSRPVYITHRDTSKVMAAVSKPPTQRARAGGFWNDIGAAVSGAALGIGNAAKEAAEWVGDKASDVGDWIYENRGTIATWAATGACFIPGVGQAACVGLQAGAFAVRTQQTVAEQGWNGQTAPWIIVDGVTSIVPFGQAIKVTRVKPATVPGAAATSADEFVDLASAARRDHILTGEVRRDGTFGGGHRPGTGFPNKTELPVGWSDDRIMHEISDIATDPSLSWQAKPGGDFLVSGTRGGVDIDVLIRHDEIWTAYPTNLPRNPS